MLTLAPCPHCATRIPDDGAYCDTCGRALAACPDCGALAKAGERCLVHGVAVVTRPPVKGGTKGAAAPNATIGNGAPAVAAPTVAPPPRRPSGAPAASRPAAPSPGTPQPPAQSGGAGQPPAAAAAPSASSPAHAARGTTVQALARKLRLVALGNVMLPPLEVEPETIVGRGEGPFAMLLDPFHDKGLSRRHCIFRRGATGTWSVTDLAGRGSTFVSADGAWSAPAVPQNGSHPVEPGRDEVRLGLITFRVEGIA